VLSVLGLLAVCCCFVCLVIIIALSTVVLCIKSLVCFVVFCVLLGFSFLSTFALLVVCFLITQLVSFDFSLVFCCLSSFLFVCWFVFCVFLFVSLVKDWRLSKKHEEEREIEKRKKQERGHMCATCGFAVCHRLLWPVDFNTCYCFSDSGIWNEWWLIHTWKKRKERKKERKKKRKRQKKRSN